jgi:hypothetical protein
VLRARADWEAIEALPAADAPSRARPPVRHGRGREFHNGVARGTRVTREAARVAFVPVEVLNGVSLDVVGRRDPEREEWRRSVLDRVASHRIGGEGPAGYCEAVELLQSERA